MSRYAKRRVTIIDVAELAGVSIATVSKVLNGKDEHISPQTILQVKEAAEELGYVPNDMARSLKAWNTKTSEELLSTLPIPCVAIDRNVTENGKIGVVRIDNYQAMYDVAEFVVEKGCRTIGYVTSGITQSPGKERFQGLVDGLEHCGIAFDRRLLYPGIFNVETGHIGAMTLLERKADLDCIVCGNDLIALGVMNVCQRMGKAIPDDIKIIGFDDIYIAKYLYPELTTVNQNAYEMGKCAA